MQLKYTVNLPIEKKNGKIICYDNRVLQLVLGTASVSGNLHKYNTVKKSNPVRWEIPITVIKDRIKEIERRIAKEEQYLEIMRQVVK